MRTITGLLAAAFTLALLAGCAGTPEKPTTGESAAETLSVARDVARGIQRDAERDRVMAEIAVEYADAGYLEEASETLKRVEGLVDRNYALAFVAASYANEGQEERSEALFGQAQGMTDRVRSPNQKAWMLSELAGRYLEVGRKERALGALSLALESANAMKDPVKQAWLLAELGSKYALAGQSDRAARLLERAVQGTGDVRIAAEAVEVLTWVSERQVDLGNQEKAGELLGQAEQWGERYRTESGPGQKARSLADIADDYIALGRKEDGERVLSRARGMLEDLEDPFWVNWTRVGVAQVLIALERDAEARGLLDSAFEASASIEDSMKKARVRTDIATAYVELGDSVRGLEVVRGIKSHSEQAWALTRIAVLNREAGKSLEPDTRSLLSAIRNAALAGESGGI